MPTDFRTIVTPQRPPFSITHADRMVSIGSCFSENIGRYFQRYKFNIDINPFGQQYNPASIAQAIDRLLSPKPYTADNLVCQDEQFHSFDHHGNFSRSSESETLNLLNTSQAHSSGKLKSASILFLTFGTAHVFKLKSSGMIVSNCHKIPGSQFDFALMSPDEIIDMLSQSFEALWKANPTIRIVLTVSPVRYFAFGHFENSVSKGHLFTAINRLKEKYSQLYYFPAYEIVMDDLRDYRFFADDMLHPTAQAIKYVWDKLIETLFLATTTQLLKELDEITNAANHRPRNPNSEAHHKFKESYRKKIEAIETKYSFDFTNEKEKLR